MEKKQILYIYNYINTSAIIKALTFFDSIRVSCICITVQLLIQYMELLKQKLYKLIIIVQYCILFTFLWYRASEEVSRGRRFWPRATHAGRPPHWRAALSAASGWGWWR